MSQENVEKIKAMLEPEDHRRVPAVLAFLGDLALSTWPNPGVPRSTRLLCARTSSAVDLSNATRTETGFHPSPSKGLG
jgi:hypothetical protein